MANKIQIYILIIFCSFLIACETKNTSIANEKWDINEFQNGDIIYRCGNGFFSDYFRKSSNREQIYSHCGIISMDNSGVYVIHSEASELTGVGGVRKETVDEFLKDISTWGLYRVDTIQSIRDSIVSIASQYLYQNTPFDLDFDNTSDDKVYCTELVALSVNKALQQDIVQATGCIRNKIYYAIDDTYFIERMKPVIINRP